MELNDYFRVLRRRWILLLIPVVGAVLIAGLTLPSGSQATSTDTQYTATATLIASPTADVTATPTVNLPVAALFATIGEVPERAAKILGFEGEPQVLASQVTVTTSSETGTLTITASDLRAKVASARANAFAQATVDYFADRQRQAAQRRIEDLNQRLETTATQLQRLQSQASDGDPVIQARLDAIQTQYSSQFAEVTELSQNLGRQDVLTILQPGVAIPQVVGGFSAPTSPWVRLGTAALLGLLLGIALALLVERLDTRLRTREQVERAYDLPVLAEIPLPRSGADSRELVSVKHPASAAAEAFRALRATLLLEGVPKHPETALTILVTSAVPAEGKSFTAANLATVMAEAGRTVLLLSMDLRNPSLHHYFSTPNDIGISDLLEREQGLRLDTVVRPTEVDGVMIATSGRQLQQPGGLLLSSDDLVDTARGLADIVIIDTPPMLTVADALDLARMADTTLVVSRLGHTAGAEAQAATRQLSRLGIAPLGLVLLGSRPPGSQDGYRLLGESRGLHATGNPTTRKN